MGQPITSPSTTIAEWTEDDLTNFIQKHLDRLPPQSALPFMHANSLRVGGSGIDLQGPITYRDFHAPICVNGSDGPGFIGLWGDRGSPYPFMQFMRDPFGWVHIIGAVVGSDYTHAFFQLPPGYRPDMAHNVAVAIKDVTTGATAAGLVTVNTDGTITTSITGTDSREFHFTGVKFPIKSNS